MRSSTWRRRLPGSLASHRMPQRCSLPCRSAKSIANLFKTINTEGTGEISFQEFLAWAMDHIHGKVAHGVQTWAAAKHLAPQSRTRASEATCCAGGLSKLISG